MQNASPPVRPPSAESLEPRSPAFDSSAESGAESARKRASKGAFSERFPLRFPKVRWESLETEERQRVSNAQVVLDALLSIRLRSLNTLESDTELEQDALGPALGVLEELGLIDWEEDTEGEDLIVSLVATPEEHLEVHFPDGESRWIFIARPLQEPDIPQSELN